MQKKEPGPIAGIVLIVVTVRDLDRVIERLRALFNIDATAYCGPMSTMNMINWSRNCNTAMIYLELEHGIWGDVVDWCRSADRAGLVVDYHYALVDGMNSKDGLKQETHDMAREELHIAPTSFIANSDDPVHKAAEAKYKSSLPPGYNPEGDKNSFIPGDDKKNGQSSQPVLHESPQ